jgi:hypothetical protein
MNNQKTESDILWNDLKELTNDLESGKLSFEDAITTITTLSDFHKVKEVTIKTNSTGLNMLQIAFDHYIEHMDDSADDGTFDEEDLAIAQSIKSQLNSLA